MSTKSQGPKLQDSGKHILLTVCFLESDIKDYSRGVFLFWGKEDIKLAF